MNRFSPILKRINEKLDLPQPIRSRIIYEISADINDLYEYYRREGFGEEEAIGKAREKFEMSNTAVSQLIQIHNTNFRKLVTKLSDRTQSIWERIFLILILLIILLPSLIIILTSDFFENSSIFLWPMFILTGIALIIFTKKFYRLFLVKNHNTKKIRRGLPILLILAGSSFFTTVCGYFIELYTLETKAILYANNFFLLLILNMGNPIEKGIVDQVSSWLIRSSAMVMTGIAITIIILVLWFFLEQKIERIEKIEMNALLGD